MNLTIPSLSGRKFRILFSCAGLACAVTLAGCAAPTAPVGVNDPHEAENREMHAFNVAADTHVLKPVSRLFGKPGGGAAQQSVANFANNLDLPGDVVNDVLQLRLGKAVENTLRFAINTTVGVGGIFDPATAMGVSGKKTDFGETLHVWGVGEGHYLELPLLGPSTARDALGEVVDSVMNPIGFLLPKPESYVASFAKVASKFGDRARYSETVDSILYDSADGYAQARLLYLQNRRYELGQTAGEDDFEDPYAE